MKVLVISDTHGNINQVVRILDQVMPLGVSTLIHCGDYIGDAKKLKTLYPTLEVHAVYGNCDGIGYGEDYTRIVEIEDVRIFITHGHKYEVKWADYKDLLIDAEAYKAKLVIYGHTHCAHLEKKGEITLLNPGSITEPRDGMRLSYAMIELDKGHIKHIDVMQILDNQEIKPHPISNIYGTK